MKLTNFKPWHPEDKEMTDAFKQVTRIYLETLALLCILTLMVIWAAVLYTPTY